jgi:hypothetical protein
MIRSACAFMGLLTLLVQGSSGGHMLLVEHTRCAEHGEWVHGHAAHHHAVGERAKTDGPSWDRSPAAGQEKAHEHCTVSADRRDAVSRLADASLIARIDGTPDREPVLPTRHISKIERFRIAPKNSPPA